MISVFDALNIKDIELRTKTARNQRFAMPIRGPETGQEGTLYPAQGGPIREPKSVGYDLDENQFPDPVRAKMQSHFDQMGLSRDQMQQHLLDMLHASSPSLMKTGANWYHEANDHNLKKAKEFGVDPEIYHAVTAVVSPGTEWGQNKEMAENIFRNLPAYNGLDDHEAANKMAKSHGWSIGYGTEPLARGIALARSQDPNDIDTILSGPKVRSFYNNLSDPDANGNDVTIDAHMLKALVNGETDENQTHEGVDRMKAINTNMLKTPNHQGASVGVYPLAASIVRDATKQFNAENGTNLSPMQVQSIIWHRQKERYSKDKLRSVLYGDPDKRIPNPGTLGPIDEGSMF